MRVKWSRRGVSPGYNRGTFDTHPGYYRVPPVASFSACPSGLPELPGTGRNACYQLAMQKVVGSNPISRSFLDPPDHDVGHLRERVWISSRPMAGVRPRQMRAPDTAPAAPRCRPPAGPAPGSHRTDYTPLLTPKRRRRESRCFLAPRRGPEAPRQANQMATPCGSAVGELAD